MENPSISLCFPTKWSFRSGSRKFHSPSLWERWTCLHGRDIPSRERLPGRFAPPPSKNVRFIVPGSCPGWSSLSASHRNCLCFLKTHNSSLYVFNILLGSFHKILRPDGHLSFSCWNCFCFVKIEF